MAASMPQEATQIATPKVETQDQQQSNQSLPQTGNDTNKDALIGAIALGVIGMSMIPMKKRTEEFQSIKINSIKTENSQHNNSSYFLLLWDFT